MAATKYTGKVQFIGMPGVEGLADMKVFIDKYGLPFPNAADQDGALWDRFGVPGQPAWVFVDRNGVVSRKVGVIAEPDLAAILDKLAAS